MPVPRLARCLRWAVRFDAVRLDADSAAIHVNRRQFHREWLRLAGVCARRRDFSEHFCSGFQYDIPFDRNVLRELRLEASARYVLRGDKANRAYGEYCSGGNRGRTQRGSGNVSAKYCENCNGFGFHRNYSEDLMVKLSIGSFVRQLLSCNGSGLQRRVVAKTALVQSSSIFLSYFIEKISA